MGSIKPLMKMKMIFDFEGVKLFGKTIGEQS